jgi:hypothetical protein
MTVRQPLSHSGAWSQAFLLLPALLAVRGALRIQVASPRFQFEGADVIP